MKRKNSISLFVTNLLLLIFFLALNSKTYSQSKLLVIDLTDHYFSVNPSSADSLKGGLERLGHTVVRTDQMPSSINSNSYDAVFCCTGMFPANGVLHDDDIQVFSNYLASGGRLYIEGGDVWYYDPIMYHTGKIETLFGIKSSYDGNFLGDVEQITGFPSSLMDGFGFTYEGFVNYTDFLYPDFDNINAFNIWDNEIDYNDGSDPFVFPVGIGCDIAGGYKTIGVCFEFSGIPTALKDSVLVRYVDFLLSENTGKLSGTPMQVSVQTEKTQNRLTLSPKERAKNHQYPKLYNEYTGDLATEARIDSLAYWDFLVLNTWNLLNVPEAFGPSGRIRTVNSNCLQFIYFCPLGGTPWFTMKLDGGLISIIDNEWYIKDVNGENLRFFHTADDRWTLILNLSTMINHVFPYYTNKHLLGTGRIDGVYYDWVTDNISFVNHDTDNPSAAIDIDNDGIADSDAKIDQIWVQGMKDVLTNSSSIYPDSLFVIGNGGSYFTDTYHGYVQGMMNECFYQGLSWLDWHDVVRGHYLMHKEATAPVFSMMQFTGEQTNYQRMRYGLSLSLILGAYYQYTSEGDYTATWWYDEYAVNRETGQAVYSLTEKGYLEDPLNPAHNAKDPQVTLAALLDSDDASSQTILWRRDFTYGTVFCNPTHQPISLTYEEVRGARNTDNIYYIDGHQDGGVNSGQQVTSGITIPAEDGLILLVDCVGTGSHVEEEKGSSLPVKYALKNVYPNPFNPVATIHYDLPKKTEIEIIVTDLMGKRVKTLYHGQQPAGSHSAYWNASAAPSGVYLIQLLTGEQRLVKKCMLVK